MYIVILASSFCRYRFRLLVDKDKIWFMNCLCRMYSQLIVIDFIQVLRRTIAFEIEISRLTINISVLQYNTYITITVQHEHY